MTPLEQQLLSGGTGIDIRRVLEYEQLHPFRREEKFLVPLETVPFVIAFLSAQYQYCQYDGSPIFHYHNTYFDTPEHACFHMHRQGKYNRMKVRIREYKNGIQSRYLECKQKRKGLLSTKQREILTDSSATLWSESIASALQAWNIDPETLVQTIDVLYERMIFVPHDLSERITIDTNLVGMCGVEHRSLLPHHAVLEIKSRQKAHPLKKFLQSHHNIRPTSFSKYCIGMCLLNTSLPSNKWKHTLRKYCLSS